MKNRASVIGAACLMVLVALVGSAAGQDRTGVSDDTILIGGFGAMSGPLSVYANHQGAMLAYEDINERGGVHGRKIKYVFEDTGGEPAKAVAAVKKLISTDGSFLIHGGGAAVESRGVRPFIVEAKIPWVVLQAVGTDLARPFSPYVFQPNLTQHTAGEVAADFAMELAKNKRIAIVRPNDEWGREVHEATARRLKEKHGTEAVTVEYLEHGATDATAQVLKIKAANPDVILVFQLIKAASLFWRTAYDHGIRLPMIGQTGAMVRSELMRDGVGGCAPLDYIYTVTNTVHTVEHPYWAEWNEKFKKKFPLFAQQPGQPASTWMNQIGSARIVIEGLQRAGKDLSREKFIAALESFREVNNGVSNSPISFSSTNHFGTSGAQVVSYKGCKMQNLGKFYQSTRPAH
jgi:branched-chain amino acid transport system substrate-binding protein